MTPPSLASPRRKPSSVLEGLKQGLLVGVAIVAVVYPWPVSAPSGNQAAALRSSAVAFQATRHAADFRGEAASPEVRHIANWVVRSGDNRQLFFVILDKINTKVFVFDASGTLQGATPVLIGAARGDDSVIGIGGRPIAEVQEHERTTPAGRFVGEPGRNTHGEDVVWVDYDAAVSMHRVRTVEPKERRLERLASPATEDHRISYGCINMPVVFFEQVLKPAFDGRYGVVYVLPEIKPISDVFKAAYGTPADQGAPPAS